MNDKNTGHGHVYERPDGMKARCGGPALCAECARDQGRLNAEKQDKANEGKSLEIVGTASIAQRDAIINSLEWEVRGRFGEQTYLLRGVLDNTDPLTIGYLYFGELKAVKSRYRVAFTAKPNNTDMIMMSPTNKKEDLQATFVTMVKMGCIAGAISRQQRPEGKAHDPKGPELKVDISGG